MNKLSKTKRDHLILVGIATAGVISALWFFVIGNQKEKLVEIENQTQLLLGRIGVAEKTLTDADKIENQLEASKQELAQREETLTPARDAYAWMLKTITRFSAPGQLPAGVGLNVQIKTPEFGEMVMIPKFFYKAATFHITGVGFYQEYGKFIADFENAFPYFRIQNLEIVPGTAPGTEAQKLSFNFDIITLVRPANSAVETRP